MKTVVYKNRRGCYDCIKIENGAGRKIKLVFEEPIDGKITVGELVFNLSRGVSEIDTARLSDGKITPLLYSGGKIKRLEGFMLSGGEISQLLPDGEYVRSLADALELLSHRIDAIEKQLCDVFEKISQQIKF